MSSSKRTLKRFRKILLSILLLSGFSQCAYSQSVVSDGSSQAFNQFDLTSVNGQAPGAIGATGATGSGAVSGAMDGVAGGGIGSSGDTGVYGQAPSRAYTSNVTGKTSTQASARLMAQTATLDRVFGGKALPPTRLDSFVKTAAGNADLIYGDEGTTSIPPFFTFDESHRIERGVYSKNLTTGHKGNLPEAWGWPQ